MRVSLVLIFTLFTLIPTISGLTTPGTQLVKCAYGNYGKYGYCLNGIKTKSRGVVRGDPMVCLDTTRTQACQDCQLSEWYNVGNCVNGQQRRKREKLNEPVNGGAKCSQVRERLVNCGGSPTINSYQVGEGPFWYTAPKAMTCLEACAYNFGGLANEYKCSTSGEMITNLGYYDELYYDTDGDDTSCPQSQSDHKKEPIYSCDGEGCSISAYVSDHNGCKEKVNFCWKNVNLPA